jgi:hypothetical protein
MYSYSILQGSRISISGSSNVNQFTCYSPVASSREFLNIETRAGSNTLRFSDASHNIRVDLFDCGNRLITRNMHNALGAKDHPFITIRIIEGTPILHNQRTGSGTAQVLISITLNGVTRQSPMQVEYEGLNTNQTTILGTKKLRMTDFGITPPSPALGLVKVQDEVTIELSLLVKTSQVVPN